MKKVILIAAIFIFGVYVRGNNKPAFTPVMENAFVENKGQIKDQRNRINKNVLYLFSNKQMNVQLRKQGFSYDIFEKQNNTENNGTKSASSTLTKFHRLDIDFVGSNPAVEIIELEKANGMLIAHSQENIEDVYYINRYKKVLYKNVYPNIDIEFLIACEGQFKYNILLHPGADWKDVKLKIKGANKLGISEEGSILMKTAFGNLEERVPLSYELNENGIQGKTISAKFRQLGSGLFGILPGNYDSQKTLVIDPIVWSTYFGGTGVENPLSMCVDVVGNVYIAGQTSSTAKIATSGSYQSSLAGGTGYDAFLSKFDASGALIWSTYFGGTGFEEINEIALDRDGNIIVAGDTYSTNGIASTGAYQSTLPGVTAGFLGKFSPLGTRIWSTYYGGAQSNGLYGVCVDIQNNIITIGSSNSTATVFSYPNIHQTTIAGLTDVTLSKFSTAGTPIWETYYGGAGNDNSYGVCADVNCNIYISGNTFSASGLSTAGSHQTSSAGGSDAYVAKFDSVGRLLFGTFYGGSASDFGSEISLDNDGNVLVVGYSSSTSGIATTGAFKTTVSGSGYDGFLLKMDNTGNPLWCTYYGGTGTEFMYNVCVDPLNNIYFAGSTTSTTEIATLGSFQTNLWGGGDAVLACFDKSGVQNFGTYFGGNSGTDEIRSIYIDFTGNLYCLGKTASDSGIASFGAFQQTRSGNADAFLLKYVLNLAPDTSIANNIISSDMGYCIGSTPGDILGSTPTGASGTYTYQWLFSPSGLPGTFGIAPGVSTGINYSPGGITTNSFYIRMVFSGSLIDTSNMCGIYFGTQLTGSFTVNKSIQCIKNNQFVFTDLTTSTGPVTHAWDFGNGFTGTKQVETVTYSPGAVNNFKVTLISSLNGACGDTNYTTVYVIPNPLTKVITGNDTLMRGVTAFYSVPASNGSSYNWLFTNGTGRSTINTINIKWTQVGSTQLKMIETSGGGCQGDTAYMDITIIQPTAEDELSCLENINLFPNPSSDGLFYFDSPNSNVFQISIFDLAGSLIYSKQQNLSEPIDLTEKQTGIYFLQVSDQTGNSYYRKLQLLR